MLALFLDPHGTDGSQNGSKRPYGRIRVPPSFLLEQEVLHEDVGDPIDPQFHAPSMPSTVAIPRSPRPTSGTDPISSIPPGTPTALPLESESDGNEELKCRRTIAERMAKLGGIKFGAPPPVNRVQPSAGAPARPTEDLAAEKSAIGSQQPAEAEQDDQARRQRIAAKLAGMGGMRLGMLPIQPGVLSPHLPPIPARREEESTPRSPPRAIAPPHASLHRIIPSPTKSMSTRVAQMMACKLRLRRVNDCG
ncbi:hypothetical protein F5148DRAFT_1233400 [Russula earlei]|uniref:Uncharacterized protein n=1 Tax=Russula earlei TaxID=71964 RepID=A0ACC0TYE1_9AGAM|nr:hypothetical protein F5148DRAFT_1233400 [Russula earlei]